MTGKAKSIRLWQEIILALVFKCVVLAIIWTVWFSAPEDISLDEKKVASRILSPPPQKEQDHVAVSRTR